MRRFNKTETQKPCFLPVGKNFNTLLNEFAQTAFDKEKTFPPYNIFQEEDKAFIELAVTGMSKEDIKAYFEDGLLVIEGEHQDQEEISKRNYSYNGLSKKNFQRKFQIQNDFEVESIKVENGLCVVKLVKIEPEVKSIKIQ